MVSKGSRDAAGRQQAHHRPVDGAGAGQAERAAELGGRREKQVGADGQIGLDPEAKISSGVIKEPPPTPVRPTTRPTKNPAKRKANSCMGATVNRRI